MQSTKHTKKQYGCHSNFARVSILIVILGCTAILQAVLQLNVMEGSVENLRMSRNETSSSKPKELTKLEPKPYEPAPPLLMSPPQEKNQWQSFEKQALIHNLSPYEASPFDPENAERIRNGTRTNATFQPRILHFIFVGDLDKDYLNLNFVNYLVIRASYFRIQPDYIYLHTNNRPRDCPLWEMVKPMISEVKYFEPELEIYGNKVSGKAHISDIKRLRVLQEYGGIYMDIDSVALRYFPDSMWNPPSGMSMGYELKAHDHMGVSMIASRKDSKFLQRWIESYKTFNDRKWADHTVLMAGSLTKQFPDEIDALHEEYFNRPLWYPETIHLLWKTRPDNETKLFDFAQTYASHYWGSFARSFGKIRRMTPKTVLLENAGIHQILRPILPSPYISIVIDCTTAFVSDLDKSVMSIVRQEFGLWEILLYTQENSTFEVESAGITASKELDILYRQMILRYTRISDHLPKSIRKINASSLATATQGIWMVKLQAGQKFDSATSLSLALDAVRNTTVEHRVPFDTSKNLDFVFRSDDPLVRVNR